MQNFLRQVLNLLWEVPLCHFSVASRFGFSPHLKGGALQFFLRRSPVKFGKCNYAVSLQKFWGTSPPQVFAKNLRRVSNVNPQGFLHGIPRRGG